jgi:hypothetical protein
VDYAKTTIVRSHEYFGPTAVRKVNGDLQFYASTERQWPVTLDDFKAFWNSVNDMTIEIVEKVDPHLYFVHAEGTEDSYQWTPPCVLNNSAIDLQYRRDDKVCSKRVVQQLPGQVFCGDIPNENTTVLTFRTP